jgi:hypothetical protein
MEPQLSLPLASGSNPEPSHFSKILFNIISTHILGLRTGRFVSGFPTKHLPPFFISPIHATCPAHLMLFGFIILIKFGEERKLCNPYSLSTGTDSY